MRNPRARHLVEMSWQTATISPGTVAAPSTTLTSSPARRFVDARIHELILIAGVPIGGPPTIQFKFQSTPNSPFVFIDIPGALGAVFTAAAGVWIARIDDEFIPAGHTFFRAAILLAGAGSLPMAATWLSHDLRVEPSSFYDQFGAAPTEALIVDSTLRGTNV